MKQFKTKPFKHQLKVHKRAALLPVFAYLMEQGTGKSWVAINSAAALIRAGEVDTILGIAPKGVAPGWIRQQFPEHMPEDIEYVAALWKSRSNTNKKHARIIKDVFAQRDKVRIFMMNTEAFGMTPDAIDFALEVLESSEKTFVFVDESQRIKTHDASTTKRILKLRKHSAYRRILTGTVAATPFDTYPQFAFLDPAILEVESFSSFKAEYSELLPESNGLLRHLAKRIPKVWKGRFICDDTGDIVTGERNPDGSPRAQYMEPKWLPNIPAKNKDGTTKFRNLKQLHDLIEPHSYRVLKRDCLDLPAKLYNRYYTELSPQQQELYEQIRDENRIEWEDGRISTFIKLTVYLRLQQVICGYIPTGEEEGKMHEIFKSWSDNPRIESTLECLADRPPGEGTIIWCRFIPDILRITEALKESYGDRSVVQYYGAVKDAQRLENEERFEGLRRVMGKSGQLISETPVPDADRPRFMVAQQRAGGIGKTWVAANLSFHYSNSFSLIDRLQAEDRPHRIGQKRTVNYLDLEAEETIDTTIINSMRAGKNVADVINGDEGVEWLR